MSCPQAYGAVNAELTGFAVDSVTFDAGEQQWVAAARYKPVSGDTVPSLYVSKASGGAVDSTFYVSQHPCMLTTSVCCLLGYRSSYTIGSFASNITDQIGTCDAAMRGRHTLGLFSGEAVDGVFQGHPTSSLERVTSSSVRLKMSMQDLESTYASVTSITGGTSMV